MNRVPALSIRQPWAELIITGKKTIEVRSWYTEYRGPLWVHTGLKAVPGLERRFEVRNLFLGGFIGTVVLEAVIPFDRRRWEIWTARHLCSSEGYVPGSYAWMLSSPFKFEHPVAGPGRLNLFYPDPQLSDQLYQAQQQTRAAN